MADADDLPSVLSRYDQARARGETVSLDDLCAGRPDLLLAAQNALGLPDPVTRTQTQPHADGTRTAPPADGGTVAQTHPPAPGRSASAGVAGYEILSELGAGGMGVVWKARDIKLNRIVALKMVLEKRAGPKELIRFLAEAEAVAAVKHPNVVQVYEYGESAGRPYLAMEFLGGTFDRTKKGPVEAARLMAKVARGVGAAHELGIVHRDLKPGNVLLDESGEPKVTDFGLAKKGVQDLTNTQAVLGTPAYMSPEQAEGRTKFVTPAADVFSLGVMLYEQLTGALPFAGDTAASVMRAIAHDDPPSPAGLPRDIALICMKCLEKAPAERYATATELAADLERFAAGETVSVRAAGIFEKSIRWAKRRPWVVGLSAALACSLVIGAALSLGLAGWALRKADEATTASRTADQRRLEAEKAVETATTEKARADQEAELAHELNEFFTTDLLRHADVRWQIKSEINDEAFIAVDGKRSPQSSSKAPDRNLTVLQALERAELRVGRKFANRPHVEVSIRLAIGETYSGIGVISKATENFGRVLVLQTELCRENHRDTAAAYSGLGEILDKQGQYTKALEHHKKALAIRREIYVEGHADTATSYNNIATNLDAQGKAAEAGLLLQKALDIRRKTLGEDHPDTATSYNNFAANLNAQGKAAEAEPLFQKALDIHRRILGDDNTDTATSYNNVAANLSAQGKAAEAGPLYWKALEIRRKTLGEDDPDTAQSYSAVALNMQAQGKPAEAGPLFQKALEIRRKTLGEDHPSTAASYNNVAVNLEDQRNSATAASYYKSALNIKTHGMTADAGPLLQKALDTRRKVLGEQHPDTATSYSNMAAYLAAQGKAADAGPMYQRALEIRSKLLGENHPDTAASYGSAAINAVGQGDKQQAIKMLTAAIPPFESSRLAFARGIDRATITQFNPRLLLAALDHTRDPAAAWAQLEYASARGLLDQQATASASRLTPIEQEEQKDARARLVALQPRLLKLVTSTKRTTAETQELDQLLVLRRTVEATVARLAVADSERAIAPADRIRSALPYDSALLYWVDVASTNGDVQEHWACVVRSTGDPKWERLPGSGPNKMWTKDDSALPKKLLDASVGRLASRNEVLQLINLLHTQRLSPVVKYLTNVKALYVVPAYDMAGIPVETLTQDYTVSYVPSGTYLALLKGQPKPAGTQLLAVGDPVFENPRYGKSTFPKRLPPGGLLLTSVLPDGAAARAGLKQGDVILKYGGVDLTGHDKLTDAIAANTAVRITEISVWRESEEKPFVLQIASGSLNVVIAADPAPVLIENRRNIHTMSLTGWNGPWQDLPGTRIELTRLKHLFGNSASVLLDSAASEQSLEVLRNTGELLNYRYLHFSTHGEGNGVRAFKSALILAQDRLPKEFVSKQGEPYLDGKLSASEVLEFWKLDAELVTLSACETAVGKNGGGDGMLGFPQAFLVAGSRSVCVALWNVDDTATVLLMSRFYENLLGKRVGLIRPMGKAAALYEAKRWLKNLSAQDAQDAMCTGNIGIARGPVVPLLSHSKKWTPLEVVGSFIGGAGIELAKLMDVEWDAGKPLSHPRYWAAFILFGDPN